MHGDPRIDTMVYLDTPEGVQLGYEVAGTISRALAWAIDAAIRGAIFIALAMALGINATQFVVDDNLAMAVGLVSVVAFALEWLYPTCFEARYGATPGKRLLGLRVVQTSGVPLTWPSAIVRNFLRAVDFLPLLYMTGTIAMLCNRDFRRLGDLAADTRVVYSALATPWQLFNYPRSVRPPATLDEDTRQAILGFAERAGSLSAARRIELADMLFPLTGQRGEAAVDTLMAWSNWIVRGQTR